MASQLLTWRAGDVYLCLHGDGTFCCLDPGPETCTCSSESLAETICQPAHCHCAPVDHRDHEHDGGQSSGPLPVSLSADECTHLWIAGITPLADLRSGLAERCEAAAGSWAAVSGDLLVFPDVDVGAPLSSPRRWIPPLFLTVLSTVALRC